MGNISIVGIILLHRLVNNCLSTIIGNLKTSSAANVTLEETTNETNSVIVQSFSTVHQTLTSVRTN